VIHRPVGRILDWSLLISCNLIWASQFVLAKLVQGQMGPVFATTLPMTIATICLVALVHLEQRRTGLRPTTERGDVARFLLIGVVGQVFAQLGVTWGVRYAPASNAALLSLTLPIVTALLAYLLLREHMTRVRWISFGLAVIGVLQCSGVDWGELRFSSTASVRGNVLIMLGVSGSAFYNVYGKKLLERYSPLEVLLYSYYAVMLCLVPLTVVLEPAAFGGIASFGAKTWIGVLLLAALQYFLSMVLFLRVLARLDATQAGLSNYLIPVFGVVIAAMVLGETLTPRMVAGALIVLASTLLVTVFENNKAGGGRLPGQTEPEADGETSMLSDLVGQHALVTGGARGIGRAIAEEFGEARCSVTLLDNHAETLDRTVADLRAAGVRAHGDVVDVRDPVGVEAAVAAAERRAPVDVLVNNAGIASEASFLSITVEEWCQLIDVNLTGMFIVGQAVARHMAARRRGVILNMASKNGLDGEAGYAHYNASKGGVVMLTKTMALELAQFGIRVNAVAPGYLQTPMSEAIDSPEFVRDFVDRYIPLGRPGKVTDAAPLFVFLASAAASFISGQVFVGDGGQLAGQRASAELLRRLYAGAPAGQGST